MYIFELLYKVTTKLIQKKSKKQEPIEIPKCQHIFLPVDSTKKVLACTKCGLLIRADQIKRKKTKKKTS